MSHREVVAIERHADLLISTRAESRRADLRHLGKLLENALALLRRGDVWFEPDEPRWIATLSEAEAAISRVHVALALAEPTAGFLDQLVALSQQLAAADFDARGTRGAEPSTSAAWSRRMLHVRTLLLDARLELAGLGSPAMVAEAQALRARADGLLDASRGEAAGVFEAAFIAAEVYFLDGKLQVQAGDREAAIERLRRAKWLYREAAYRGAVGSVQVELLALLHGGWRSASPRARSGTH